MIDVVRKPIFLPRVDLTEAITSQSFSSAAWPKDLKLINVRGCNGCGKSSIPLQMLATDRKAFIYTLYGKDVATCFPTYKFIAMGRYRTKTGGLDGFSGNGDTREVLEMLLQLPYHIIMEGVISSTIFSTYNDLFAKIESFTDNTHREVGIMNLLPPLEVALARVQKRNGGKEVKTEQIASKWNTVKKNAWKFLEAGRNSWVSDNSKIALDETVAWFLNEIEVNFPE